MNFDIMSFCVWALVSDTAGNTSAVKYFSRSSNWSSVRRWDSADEKSVMPAKELPKKRGRGVEL